MLPRERKARPPVRPIAPDAQTSIDRYSRPVKAGLHRDQKAGEVEGTKKRKASELADDAQLRTSPRKRAKAGATDALPTPDQTPVKARKFISVRTNPLPRQALRTGSSSSIGTGELNGAATALPSPPSTPSHRDKGSPRKPAVDLPTPLLELVELHSAFLRALSLHYAHNSSLSPVDIRIITAATARCWGRRKPSLQDIQRILGFTGIPSQSDGNGLDQGQTMVLKLTDYGNRRICVEQTGMGRSASDQGCRFPADKLQSRFLDALTLLWNEWSAQADPAAFLARLPLHPIELSPSVSKAEPALARGQRRLTDFRARLERAVTPVTSNPAELEVGTKPTMKRTQSLLDRIKLKEVRVNAHSTIDVATRADRRMAFGRLNEIIDTLDMLSTPRSNLAAQAAARLKVGALSSLARGKTSFSLAQLSQTLQQSLKNPISPREVENCINLLAKEVAPSWVEVYSSGRITGVVLNTEHRDSVEGWKGLFEHELRFAS